MTSLITWATDPYWPIMIGAGLYAWATLGFIVKGQLWLAAMWGCYSLANIFFATHVHKVAGT